MKGSIVTWAYSKTERKLVHVDSVPNGYNCGCICVSCNKPLSARQGDNNEHSFAHRSNKDEQDCHYFPESTIHWLAKQIIKEEKKVMFPSNGKDIPLATRKEFEDVKIEDRSNGNDQRPDIVCIDKEGVSWYIEIRYSNPLDAQRKSLYRDKHLNCLEIDVREISAIQDENASKLRDFLLNRSDKRVWISTETEEKTGNISDNLIRKIPFKIENLKLSGKSNPELLEQLNESQREAVLFCDGPSLVIAGAGSGKTRVLTYKIAYLLEQGLKPWQILALTFTNKAAREMKERIGRLVGEERARYLQMGTFHSVFSRILRAEADKLGFSNSFTIYDQTDARSLVKAIIKEMGLDDKVYKPASVADRISMAKNHLILASHYGQTAWAQDDAHGKRPQIANIYIRYAERCRQSNAMDFDDLLVYTYVLFQQHEDVRQKYVEKFQYVLVDEYQDTNYAQQAIVLQLTQERQRVCVVGDDAQSIYSFRGANIDNILNFRNSYDNARLFKLEQNYRSTQLIVQAANSLIRKNERQIPKDVYSKNEVGERLVLKPAYSDKEEALIVCQDIKRIRREDHCEYCDFAILYRTNSQSRSFEEQMRKDNIPYRIYGGLSFYQRKEIKDVIAYFRLVANPDDEEAFKRIVNYPTRGIGGTTVDKIVRTATDYGVSLWRVISDPVLFPLEVSKGTMTKIEAFKDLIQGWRERLQTEDAYVLGHDIIMTSGISRDIYSGRNPEDISRQENLEEFLGGMQDFVESRREEDMGNQVYLPDFLQEVALLTDLDSDNGDDNDKVTLMTIHSAKGLEFPTVFVVGLEENIFPSPMCTNSMRELEEERRLLYVAITRAEKHCILTCAQNRFRYGRMEYDTPSRFIKDFDPSLIKVLSEKGGDEDTYTRRYGQSTSRGGDWMQNPRPVATQFKADPKPRIVPPRQAETPVDPFSDSFKRTLQAASGGRFKPVQRATPSASPSATGDLREGDVIEHQRFGIGKVIRIEGTGENQKATVEFKNTGTKQLLLKFARYKKL